MAPSPISARYTNSESVFKPDIFKGKVLFCTGGGSGICKEMTYAMVRCYSCLCLRRALMRLSRYTDETRCRRGNCRKKVGALSASRSICHVTYGVLTGRLYCRLDRITQAAEELSKATGNTCIPARADVRKPDELKEAVRITIEKFGRIDFVICGGSNFRLYLVRQSDNLTLTAWFVGRCRWQLPRSPFRTVGERLQDRH